MLHILYSNRSAARVALGKVEEALSDASECIKLKPDFPKGYTRRAECLLRMKRYSEAIEAYEKALALEPTNSVAKEGKSRCLAAISNAKYAVRPFYHPLNLYNIQSNLSTKKKKLISSGSVKNHFLLYYTTFSSSSTNYFSITIIIRNFIKKPQKIWMWQ